MSSSDAQEIHEQDTSELQVLSSLDISVEELEQRLELSTALQFDLSPANVCVLNACVLNLWLF